MPNEAVHPSCVEHFRDLAFCGVAPRGSARGVANGQGADELAKHGNSNAAPRYAGIKRPEIRIPTHAYDQSHQHIPYQGEKRSAFEKPIARALKFFYHRHVRSRSGG